MSCGIYLIHNKINGKNYVGQSTNIERRFTRHKNTAYNENHPCYDLPLYRAIRKYGVENFDFSALELCNESELNKKEMEYIEKYNAYTAGYNNNLGGGGNKIPKSEKIAGIFYDLENTFMSHAEIADKWGVNVSTVSWINEGIQWQEEGRKYPIQNPDAYIIRHGFTKASDRKCASCGKQISAKALHGLCRTCLRTQQSKGSEIDRQTLKDLLRNLPMTNIGMMFGVTDNAVRKWCKKLGLPFRKSDIDRFSATEWATV